MNCWWRNQHGSRYIKQCVDLITQNKITIVPYYLLDIVKLPSISVVADYRENLDFLGDFGNTCTTDIIPPAVITTLNAIKWPTELNGLVCNEHLDLLQAGLWLRQDQFITRIKYILPASDNSSYTIFTEDDLPRIKLIDWEVVTNSHTKIAEIHTSSNDVEVMINLKSSGDIEVHKLLALVVRYCLKSHRLFIDSRGLQLGKSSQSYPIPYDQEQGIFQTNFNLNGKYFDSWIQYEETTKDVNVEMIATRSTVSTRSPWSNCPRSWWLEQQDRRECPPRP